MTREDDWSKDRLDEDQERLVRAAAPYGFELRQPRKRPLEEHELQAFQPVDTVLTRLTGEVDGALVDVFEYDWVQQGTKGSVSRGRRILTVLRHPAFEGQARCVADRSTLLGTILIGLLFVFLFVTLFWLIIPLWLWELSKGRNPFKYGWRIGGPEFRRRFKAHGPSREQAMRAFPESVQSLVVAENLGGPIEVRPGVLAFGIEAPSFDPATFERAIRVAKRFVGAYAPSRAEPATAYRVAPDAGEPSDEDGSAVERRQANE